MSAIAKIPNPLATLSLMDLCRVSVALERCGYRGICERCAEAIERDPLEVARILGTALEQLGKALIAGAAIALAPPRLQ
jgi:hypothetical protein